LGIAGAESGPTSDEELTVVQAETIRESDLRFHHLKIIPNAFTKVKWSADAITDTNT
jgi:hypothetical protein